MLIHRPLEEPLLRRRIGCQVEVKDIPMAFQGAVREVPPSDPLDEFPHGLGKSAAYQLRRVAADD